MEIQAEAAKRLREFLQAQQANVDQCEPNLEPSTSRNSLGRLSKQINSRISDDCWTNDSASIRNIPVLGATKTIFIRKLELTINGTPIDQVKRIDNLENLWVVRFCGNIFFDKHYKRIEYN